MAEPSRCRRLLRTAVVLLTAIALLPSGAHLLELPNKIALPRDAYMVVQGIYAGWAWGGVAWVAALLANLALAVVLRRQGGAWHGAAVAAALILLAFAVFLVWTQPANRATENWTFGPPQWEALRRQWEWSHAANALLLLGALLASTRAAVGRRTAPADDPPRPMRSN